MLVWFDLAHMGQGLAFCRTATQAKKAELTVHEELAAMRRLCRDLAKREGNEEMRRDTAVVRHGSARIAGLGFTGFQAALGSLPELPREEADAIQAAILRLHATLADSERARTALAERQGVKRERLRLRVRIPWRLMPRVRAQIAPAPPPVQAQPWALTCTICSHEVRLDARPKARPGGAGWPFGWCPGCGVVRRVGRMTCNGCATVMRSCKCPDPAGGGGGGGQRSIVQYFGV